MMRYFTRKLSPGFRRRRCSEPEIWAAVRVGEFLRSLRKADQRRLLPAGASLVRI
jgi:hypothetical protein